MKKIAKRPHSDNRQPKVAIVADWLYGGGAEKVVEALHQMYPSAPIYSSYCTDEWRKKLNDVVITGYLQHWPFSALRRFLPVMRQWWFTNLNLSSYDIVISSSGNGESKFVRTEGNQIHVCYCHTPPHFYWAQYDEYLRHPSMRPYFLARLGLKLLVKQLRKRDYEAAQQVDFFIANSTAIQSDITAFYGRESTVIHPPVDVGQFMHSTTGDEKSTITERPSFIWWGRIVPAKRLDIAIEACNMLKLRFTIIGNGPDTRRLKSLSGPTITFTGYASDAERKKLIGKADAFLFPAREDFGIAPVEALAAGLPVIAYEAGGALDYVKNGENGVFFEDQNPENIIRTVHKTIGSTYDRNIISHSAERFSQDNFKRRVKEFLVTHSKGTRL